MPCRAGGTGNDACSESHDTSPASLPALHLLALWLDEETQLLLPLSESIVRKKPQSLLHAPHSQQAGTVPVLIWVWIWMGLSS